MLDAAGWKVGASGVREKNGVPMKFEIMAPTESPEYTKTAQVLEASFKQIGVGATVNIIQYNQLRTKMFVTREFDSMIFGGMTQFPDPDLSLIFASANAASGGQNGSGYKSPEVDQLLVQAAGTIDRAKRKEIYFKIQNILNEDAPSIPVNYWNALWIRNKRVKNLGFPDGHIGPATFSAGRPQMGQVWVTDGK